MLERVCVITCLLCVCVLEALRKCARQPFSHLVPERQQDLVWRFSRRHWPLLPRLTMGPASISTWVSRAGGVSQGQPDLYAKLAAIMGSVHLGLPPLPIPNATHHHRDDLGSLFEEVWSCNDGRQGTPLISGPASP